MISAKTKRQVRRREAKRQANKAKGLCHCGNDIGPDINPRTGQPYKQCRHCRYTQRNNAKRLFFPPKTATGNGQ